MPLPSAGDACLGMHVWGCVSQAAAGGCRRYACMQLAGTGVPVSGDAKALPLAPLAAAGPPLAA